MEKVVLLDPQHQAIGEMDKALVHHRETPLHLGFSCYVANSAGQILVTRRALDKKTWPGVWSNAFCGHPAPSEPVETALVRRAEQELGFEVAAPSCQLPEFRYRAVDDSGVVENEFCPVFVTQAQSEPQPNPSEVMAYRWVWADELAIAVEATPWAFSPWMVEQLKQLKMTAWYQNRCSDKARQ